MQVSQTESDMDEDFDVRQRSAEGCIPPLLSMTRIQRHTIEGDEPMAEQEVRTVRPTHCCIDALPTRRSS